MAGPWEGAAAALEINPKGSDEEQKVRVRGQL